MRRRSTREPDNLELTLAVGLVWGHLHAQQPEEAYLLARGCLELWPEDRDLAMMAAYAATELAEPPELERLRAADLPADAAAFVALVERRAGVAAPV